MTIPTQEAGQLLVKAGQGDHSSFQKLVAISEPTLDFLCVKHGVSESDLDDIKQLTFIKLWKTSEKFNPVKSNYITWLNLLFNNSRIDFLRRKAKHKPCLDVQEQNIVEEKAKEIPSFSWDVFVSLGQQDKDLIRLKFGNDISLKEISKILEIPSGTARTRFRCIKEKLTNSPVFMKACS